MKTKIPAENYLSSGDYLAVVRDFALSKGISLQTLLADSEISLEDLINPPVYVNNLITNRVGINLYEKLDDPVCDAAEFGLRMTASTHGSLGLAVQCAPNLREAYSILRAFFNTRINSQDIRIEELDDVIIMSLVSKTDRDQSELEVQRFFDLATLISIATNTYNILDRHELSGSMSIQVDQEEPENFPFHKISGVNVLFDQERLTLTMPKSWLDTSLSIANPDMAKVAVERCESELKMLSPMDLVAKVKSRLQQTQDAIPTLDQIAQEFHMSAATFKRKLKEQATNYQELKNEERLDYAVKLMKSSKDTIESIAAKLGFSDASNFTKAFKTWTGKTPKDYRDSE